MNSRDPLHPLLPDDSSAIATFADQVWDEQIIPALTDYIAIPAKSPMFDADWRSTATSSVWCATRRAGSRGVASPGSSWK